MDARARVEKKNLEKEDAFVPRARDENLSIITQENRGESALVWFQDLLQRQMLNHVALIRFTLLQPFEKVTKL